MCFYLQLLPLPLNITPFFALPRADVILDSAAPGPSQPHSAPGVNPRFFGACQRPSAYPYALQSLRRPGFSTPLAGRPLVTPLCSAVIQVNKFQMYVAYLIRPGARDTGKFLNTSPQLHIFVCGVEIPQAVFDVRRHARQGDVTKYHSRAPHAIVFVIFEAQQTEFFLNNNDIN